MRSARCQTLTVVRPVQCRCTDREGCPARLSKRLRNLSIRSLWCGIQHPARPVPHSGGKSVWWLANLFGFVGVGAGCLLPAQPIRLCHHEHLLLFPDQF